MDIVESTAGFEARLGAELGATLVEADLAKKRKRMAKNAMLFLRATFWRWSERILDNDLCPRFAEAPRVLAVGDIHLQNFGTWRDREGRLVWGVNDFDEAAEMPYFLDLLRLAVSAVLTGLRVSARDIGAAILKGYRQGLADPAPTILDRDHIDLRVALEVSAKKRRAFWARYDPDARQQELRAAFGAAALIPPIAYSAALAAATPEPGLALRFWPESTGGGSLGRPRWTGCGDWLGAPFVREAKGILPSAWTLRHGRQPLQCETIATGRFRSPDPWYRLHGTVLVRRRSPNNRKLDFEDRAEAAGFVDGSVLELMGRDLAAIHLGTGDSGTAIRADLARRRVSAFEADIGKVVNWVSEEFRQWRRHQRAAARSEER